MALHSLDTVCTSLLQVEFNTIKLSVCHSSHLKSRPRFVSQKLIQTASKTLDISTKSASRPRNSSRLISRTTTSRQRSQFLLLPLLAKLRSFTPLEMQSKTWPHQELSMPFTRDATLWPMVPRAHTSLWKIRSITSSRLWKSRKMKSTPSSTKITVLNSLNTMTLMVYPSKTN